MAIEFFDGYLQLVAVTLSLPAIWLLIGRSRCFKFAEDALMLLLRYFWLLGCVVLWILRTLAQQICALLALKRTREKLKKQQNINERYREALRQAELKNNDLYEQLRELQQQTDYAVTRLSELMSLKLRDGNPDVVELSDKYRPSKLAEWSGELYDNEWKDAYEFLETNIELGDTSERQHIQFLLDVLLETFDCCTKICKDEWEILVSMIGGNNAIIDEEDEQLLKNLRRNHKTERLQDIEEKCLDQLERRHQGPSCFKSKPILQFVQGCVKLCWLMQFQDPPVVFACPERNSPFPKSMVSPVSMDNRSYSLNYDLQPQNELDESEQNHQNDLMKGEIIFEKTEPETGGSHVRQTPPRQFAEPSLVSGSRSQGGQAVASRGKRILFDRSLYKDFTKTGKFIDFIVWPIIYLHEGGPILGKGVAQGCD